jgi:hypothetical protein
MEMVGSNTSELLPCVMQREPARKLVNFSRVPVLIETGEASYHAMYDYCFVLFLRRAGVGVEHLELGSVGVKGNAHLQFLEGNSE